MTTRNFEDTADNHSRSTQSLLRTMRLDVVLLSSQHNESRSTLSKLEQDWVMLQKMLLEAQRKKECENKNEMEEEAKKEKEHSEDDVMVVNSRAMKQQPQKKKSPQPHCRRHSSSIEWSDQDQQDTTRTLNLSDFSNQMNHQNSNKSSATSTPNLDRSNLDWGALDDEIQEEDRKAERAGPLTVDTILKQAGNSGGGDDDDDDDDNVPPLKRIFGWNKRDSRPDRNSNLLLSTNSASSTATESSFFGRRIRKKQEGGDDAKSTISEGAQQRNSFLSLFRWDGNNRSGGGINENKSIPEDTPIVGASATTTTKEEKGGDEADLTDEISTMQIKLRGCDAAASSLHQLVSFQKRQITDLQHERNRLKVLSEFESLQDQLELKSLQTQAVSAREERDRKEDLLEQLFIKRDLLADKEEKLLAELECIRMELSMLNMQLENDSRDYDELEEQN